MMNQPLLTIPSSSVPLGTVTFLFTDIEGSSLLWERCPDAMTSVIEQHDHLLSSLCIQKGGYVFKRMGDGICAAFEAPLSALTAAIQIQRALAIKSWEVIGGLRVRIGIHTGVAVWRENDYFGQALNRVARIMSAAHGGQILISGVTAELLKDFSSDQWSLRHLGEHRLKGLERSEHLYQVLGENLESQFPFPRTLEQIPNNLPRLTTSFIGRLKELDEVKRLIASYNLVTLVGSGGTGKTRMAVEAAIDVVADYPDGSWLVELALISDEDHVLEAIATVLEIRSEGNICFEESLLNYLGPKNLLLLLDNCEHVTTGCAAVVQKILYHCPKVHIVATSRNPLGVAGEVVWNVPPLGLAIPKSRYLGSDPNFVKTISQCDAVKLFAERAAAVRPDFAITPQNALAVAKICSRLDGIPLAIELAAARIKVMTAEQIVERLKEGFGFLRSNRKDVLPRQQTLKKLISWSYELLTQKEQLLLSRLAVFSRGRTLKAVEAVCSGEGIDRDEIIDLIQQLIDKSLIAVEEGPAREVHYILTESLWEFIREKFEASEEFHRIQERHLDYFLAYAEELRPKLLTKDQLRWLGIASAERMNFQKAVEYALVTSSGPEKCLRLVAALERLWEIQGNNLQESLNYTRRALARPEAEEPSIFRAEALLAAARLSWCLELNDEARRFYQLGLELYQKHGVEPKVELARCLLGFIERNDGHLDIAEKLFHSGLAAGKRLRHTLLTAAALNGLGTICQDRGDYFSARQYKDESLKLYRQAGDRWVVAIILWSVARAALAQKDVVTATNALEELLMIARSYRNRWLIHYALTGFGHLKLFLGKPRQAARILAAAETLKEELGLGSVTIKQIEREDLMRRLEKALPPDELADIWHEGRSANLKQLIEELEISRTKIS
ncbi:MAG: adenylate/guanylate cyclase domain-containing protein [Verrucomicrobia bacterium]|nr:MAG: adenylate/guanylate cyclase domain-containing protein [Verrucomicrobiota bacterium]